MITSGWLKVLDEGRKKIGSPKLLNNVVNGKARVSRLLCNRIPSLVVNNLLWAVKVVL